MTNVHHAPDISKDNVRVDDLAPLISRTGLVVGVIGLGGSVVLALAGPESFFRGYVANYAFFLSLGLGGLFFTMLQHLTRAGWSVTVRRLAENLSAGLAVLGVLALPIVLAVLTGWPEAIRQVYPWIGSHDHIIEKKAGYLAPGLFAVRFVIYFAIWLWLAGYFRRTSIEQDQSGDYRLSLAMGTRAAPGMLLFALTLTFAAIDLLMTLEPKWFSTIFGVIYFAGANVGVYATLIILIYLLHRAGRATHSIGIEHMHDLGKLLFAFMVFWAYVSFSQYMLIWYANLPEETTWYVVRQQDGWQWLTLWILFGHFVIPFLALISRWPKRRPHLLVIGAVWMLVMHWFDMVWQTLPHAEGAVMGEEARNHALQSAKLLWSDVAQLLTCLAAIGGFFVWRVAAAMGQAPVVPLKDPRLHESLAFENI